VLVTKRFEEKNTPRLHEVIPVFDILDDELTIFINNGQVRRGSEKPVKERKTVDPLTGEEEFPSYHPIVRFMASRALAPLDKYYSLTDESIFYRAAIRTLTSSLSGCMLIY
jgi:hypothetical protein